MANSRHKCVNGVKIPEPDIMLEKGDIIYLSNNIHDRLSEQNSEDIKNNEMKCRVGNYNPDGHIQELDVILDPMYGNIGDNKLYGKTFDKYHYRHKMLCFRNSHDNREYIVYSDCSKNAERKAIKEAKELAAYEAVGKQKKPSLLKALAGLLGTAASRGGHRAHRRINKTKRMRSKDKHSRKVQH